MDGVHALPPHPFGADDAASRSLPHPFLSAPPRSLFATVIALSPHPHPVRRRHSEPALPGERGRAGPQLRARAGQVRRSAAGAGPAAPTRRPGRRCRCRRIRCRRCAGCSFARGSVPVADARYGGVRVRAEPHARRAGQRSRRDEKLRPQGGKDGSAEGEGRRSRHGVRQSPSHGRSCITHFPAVSSPLASDC